MITEVERKARITLEDFYKVGLGENEKVKSILGLVPKKVKTDEYYEINGKRFRLRSEIIEEPHIENGFLTVKNKKAIGDTEANEEIETQLTMPLFRNLKKSFELLGAVKVFEKKKTGFCFHNASTVITNLDFLKKYEIDCIGGAVNVEFFRVEGNTGYKDYFLEIEVVNLRHNTPDEQFVKVANEILDVWFDYFGFKDYENRPYEQLIKEYTIN